MYKYWFLPTIVVKVINPNTMDVATIPAISLVLMTLDEDTVSLMVSLRWMSQLSGESEIRLAKEDVVSCSMYRSERSDMVNNLKRTKYLSFITLAICFLLLELFYPSWAYDKVMTGIHIVPKKLQYFAILWVRSNILINRSMSDLKVIDVNIPRIDSLNVKHNMP